MKVIGSKFLIALSLILAATALVLFLQMNLLRIYGKGRMHSDPVERAVTSAHTNMTLLMEDCSAEAIIWKSYNEVYRPFIESCRMDVPAGTCMTNYLNRTSNDDQTSQLPWWFQSMLRKSRRSNKVLSPAHNIYFDDPPVKFCTIEKIGTLTWRYLKNDFYEGRKTVRQSSVANAGVPLAVFTRDPLERFLSGYIDKCVNNVRHLACEPLGLFMNPEVRKLFGTRQFFDSFLSGVPFSWNLHFVPQSLFCNGLFRYIKKYDFVGSMDSDRFLADLKRFQQQFPGRLSKLVQEKFHVDEMEQKQIKDITKILEEHQNKHYTGASKQVADYYTADAVRQVLKYTAIDYVSLNLTVPTWAQEMLTEDCLKRGSL